MQCNSWRDNSSLSELQRGSSWTVQQKSGDAEQGELEMEQANSSFNGYDRVAAAPQHHGQDQKFDLKRRARNVRALVIFITVIATGTTAPRLFAATSDGFDYPVGPPNGSGYYNAQDFGYWNSSYGGYHLGEDWNGNGGENTDCNDPVYAVSNGTIVSAQSYGGAWEKVIIIRHTLPGGSQVESMYGHLRSMLRTSGDVTRGEQIGTIGDGNGAFWCHLHLEMRTTLGLTAGPGYSTSTSGKTDPSDYIDSHRTLACTYNVGQGAYGSELTAIQNAHTAVGGKPVLGCPTSTVNTNGFTSYNGTKGHFQSFSNGEIEYITNNTHAGKAFAVVGPIYSKWGSLGWNTSNPLGYPTENMSAPQTSCYSTQYKYQNFEGGAVEYHLNNSRAGQAFEVHGAIKTKWAAKGYAGCPLGLPISDERDTLPSAVTGQPGKVSDFEGGHIHWVWGAAEAFETHGSIDDRYTVQMAGTNSWLGFPISDEYAATYARNDFEGGYITSTDGVNYYAFPYSPGASSAVLATGGLDGNSKDELIIDFGDGTGVWALYNNSDWERLHDASAEGLYTAYLDAFSPFRDVLIDFGAATGFWAVYNPGFHYELGYLLGAPPLNKLSPVSPEGVVASENCGSADEVFVDFGSGNGIWVIAASWWQLHPSSPASMVTGDLDSGYGDDDVIVDFGGGNGLWVLYNDCFSGKYWAQIHSVSPQSMVIGDLDSDGRDDLIMDYGSAGIWILYNNNGWVPLHPTSPEAMVTGDMDGDGLDDLIIDFGAAGGIWIYYNNSSWAPLHPTSPQSMVTGDLDGNGRDEVIIDFGAAGGIWVYYNNGSWFRLR